MNNIHTKISSIVKRGVITLGNDDSKSVSHSQISYLGKTSNMEQIFPYGYSAQAPVGNIALCFAVGGNEANLAGIPYSQQKRFKGLKSGEVAVGSPVSGSYVKFLANGDIEIVSKQNVMTDVVNEYGLTTNKYSLTVNSDFDASIKGDYGISVDGNFSIASADFAMVNGNATVQNITVKGLDANKTVVTDANKKLISGGATTAELDHLSGLTGNIQDQLNDKEDEITAGTSSQYWRGDKTWQTLDTLIVPENTNLYYTDARARAAISAVTPVTYNPTTGVIGFSNRSVFIPGDTPSQYLTYRVRSIGVAGNFSFNFVVPSDFNNLIGAYVQVIITAGAAQANRDIDIDVQYNDGAGQLYNQYTASDVTTLYDMTGYTNRFYNLPFASLLTNLKAGSIGNVKVTHNAIGGAIYYTGVLLEYS